MLTLFVVSDGTARTVERLVHSALVQFANAEVHLVRKTQIRTAEQIRVVVQDAAAENALIVHTLVSDRLRQLLFQEAHRQGVEATDVMGPLLDRLSTRLQLKPQETPGVFEPLNDPRTRQIEAVDFAFRHDDGQSSDDLTPGRDRAGRAFPGR